MLKYFIAVSRDLALTSLLLALLSARLLRLGEKKGQRCFHGGLAAGTLLAALITFLRNATKILDASGGTGMWNVRLFVLAALALLLFSLGWALNRGGKTKTFGLRLQLAGAAILPTSLLAYALPSVLGYPFNFSLNGESLLSTAFLYRFLGWLLGLVLISLIFHSLRKLSLAMGEKATGRFLAAVLLINAFLQFTRGIQVLHAKRVIRGSGWFALVRFSSNYSDFFIYLSLLLLLALPLTLLWRSAHQKEPYTNPAEARKIRAKWRSIRRYALLFLVCLLLLVLTLTILTELDNKEIVLSPVEDCEQRGDVLYIPFEQVEDGHLHRFAYTTERDVQVRFIVIKKPNSQAYGIGLDACEICGETGYYERGGQVVCNLCDVVMNINTIGFKGGCNPIVIDYRVEDGAIVIPVSTLIKHEKIFK